MSRPFYNDAKKAKMCRSSSSFLSHFLFPHDLNGHISTKVRPIFTKFRVVMQNGSVQSSRAATLKKFEFQKFKMADGRHFENNYIAISLKPILMKFGRVTRIGPLQQIDC